MSRAQAERRGRRSEGWAALWLRLHGWRIVARRVRTPRGEIDLIAIVRVRQFDDIAFVEVKWRGRGAALDQAIDEHRLRRVAAAAEAVGHRYARGGDAMRIDVLLLAPGCWPRHVVNVWQP